eukprot:2356808-Heterocapsa_arctica.AAC.1
MKARHAAESRAWDDQGGNCGLPRRDRRMHNEPLAVVPRLPDGHDPDDPDDIRNYYPLDLRIWEEAPSREELHAAAGFLGRPNKDIPTALMQVLLTSGRGEDVG